MSPWHHGGNTQFGERLLAGLVFEFAMVAMQPRALSAGVLVLDALKETGIPAGLGVSTSTRKRIGNVGFRDVRYWREGDGCAVGLGWVRRRLGGDDG